MKIDIINKPDITGKSPQDALSELSKKLGDTMELVVRLNNEVEDMKAEIRRIKR